MKIIALLLGLVLFLNPNLLSAEDCQNQLVKVFDVEELSSDDDSERSSELEGSDFSNYSSVDFLVTRYLSPQIRYSNQTSYADFLLSVATPPPNFLFF